VPMLYGFVNEMWLGIDDQMQDLQEVLVKYFNTYENKSKQDREEFYNKEVLPLVQDINKLHATGMYEFFKNVKGQVDTADFENVIKLISSDKTFESKIRNHVLDFDAKSALDLVSSLQKNIKERIKTPEIKKFMNSLAKNREEASKAKEEISNIEKVNIPLVVPSFEKEEAAIPSKEVESPAKQETEILVFGDSIGLGIRSELGAKGSAAENLRTDQILKNMEDFFSSQEINESKENEKDKKTIIISAGINDLASGISPEKIIGNLNKMINLAKSKGYNVRVVPLLGWKGEKQDQIDQINTALSNNPNITLIDKSGIELSDGIHPKGYKDLASRATSGVLYKKPKKQDKAPLQKKRLAPAVKPSNKAEKYFPIVNTVASSEGLNPYLMMGIIFAESGFNPNAVSNKGAQGLMQLMPRTASEFDVSDPFNPEQNIKGGAKAFRTIRDVYVPRVMEKTGTKIKWNSLTEEEKDRLGLYAYNFGPNGLLVNNFKIEKSDTIEDYFARVNAWYLKKFGYDYADKIFRYANAYGGDYKKLGTSQAGIKKPLKTKPAGEPITTSTTTDTKAIQEQISAIDKASNFNELMSAYDNLFGKTLGSVARSTSDMILAHNQLDKEDLSSFLKDRVEYLKAIHSANRSDWKKEYENDLKDPKKKDDADKKMAFYHRPILYTTLRPSGAQKFFSDAINMSFGFEPNTNAVSVNYSGGAQWGVPDTFYKEHRQGNKNYSRFLSELQLLDSATKSIQDKVKDLSSSDSENRDALNELSEYNSRLADIVSAVNKALRDPSTSVSRKAYLLSVLDLALRTI
jgi:lysophospholipase L1-like esterase